MSLVFDLHDLGAAIEHHGDHLREAEGANHGGDQPDAALHLGEAEGEAVGHVEAFLPDHGHRQAKEASDPALERIVHGRQLARDQDAEYREPEELMRLEGERVVGELRRHRRQEHHADQGAEEGARGGGAHGRAGAAHLRQRIAVERGGRVGGRARNVEQDGRAAAAVDGAHIEADEDQQRRFRVELIRQRREQRHAHGGGEAGHHADGDAEQRGANDVEHHGEAGEVAEGVADIAGRVGQVSDDILQRFHCDGLREASRRTGLGTRR